LTIKSTSHPGQRPNFERRQVTDARYFLRAYLCAESHRPFPS